jgi:hypothetical protein
MLEVCILSDKYPDALTLNDVLKTQTPIQLPSDEEIQKESKFKSNHNNPQAVQFNPALNIVWVEGAKWMRDKIEGGNK